LPRRPERDRASRNVREVVARAISIRFGYSRAGGSNRGIDTVYRSPNHDINVFWARHVVMPHNHGMWA